MDNPQQKSNMHLAIRLAKAGKRLEARTMLLEVVQSEPHNLTAWFWLVEVMDTKEERVVILEECQRLNPESERVKNILTALKATMAKKEESEPAEEPDFNESESLPVSTKERDADLPSTSETKMEMEAAPVVVPVSAVEEQVEQTTADQRVESHIETVVETPEPVQQKVTPKPGEKASSASRVEGKKKKEKKQEQEQEGTISASWWVNLIAGFMLVALVAIAVLVMALRGWSFGGLSGNLNNPTAAQTTAMTQTGESTPIESIPSMTITVEAIEETTVITATPEWIEPTKDIESTPTSTPYVPVRTATHAKTKTISSAPKIELTLSQNLEGASPLAVNPVVNIMASIKPNQPNIIQEWDPTRGEAIRQFGQEEHLVRSMAFSTDGTILATGGDDKEIQLWEVGSGDILRIFVRHSDTVIAIAFSPDGRVVASADRSNTILFWILQDSDIIHSITNLSERIYSLVFTPDGSTLISGGGDGAVRLWRVSDGVQVDVLVGHADAVKSLAIRARGDLMASGSGMYGKDQSVWVWDMESGDGKQLSPTASQPVNSVAFSPDGSLLAAGIGGDAEEGNGVMIWHADSGKLLASYTAQEAVRSVAFSRDGSTLLAATDDRIIVFTIKITP